MKHLKEFESFRNEKTEAVNEALGLALLAGGALMLGAPAAYDWAKKFWTKNVVSQKYKPTGKKVTIKTVLPAENKISYTALLSSKQRQMGEVITELVQFEDNLGNLFWGYEHLWSDDDRADYNEYAMSTDLYMALFKQEDFEKLKKFLENGERYTGKANVAQRPKPIEMIFMKKTSGTTEHGNY